MCEQCNFIRQHAGLITQFSFGAMNTRDALHCIATMYALAKRDAIDHNVSEKDFDAIWNELTKFEMENINELNPIEPTKFDDKYDFRSILHK